MRTKRKVVRKRYDLELLSSSSSSSSSALFDGAYITIANDDACSAGIGGSLLQTTESQDSPFLESAECIEGMAIREAMKRQKVPARQDGSCTIREVSSLIYGR